MIGVTIFILAALYYYTPSKRLRWRDVLPGSIFATIAWIIASMGFSFYVDNFNNYSRLYGSIGAVIVFFSVVIFNIHNSYYRRRNKCIISVK